MAVTVAAVVPVFITFEAPLRVVRVHSPVYLQSTPTLPDNDVVLTVPFAVTGSTQPMLWQAVEGMHFRLAGAALKTPNAFGGPVGTGVPGSARRILTDLTISGAPLPTGTAAELAVVRQALQSWQVSQVVITGSSRDPVYTSGFFTEAIGAAPTFERDAWVWTLAPGGPSTPPAAGVTLAPCRGVAALPVQRHEPLTMARCVLFAAGRSA